MSHTLSTRPKSGTMYRSARRESGTPPAEGNVVPFIRLERSVTIRPGTETSRWHEYLNTFSKNNRMLQVKDLGSLALTYVPSRVLVGMLDAKYKRYSDDYRTTLSIHRDFSSQFAAFIRTSLKIAREVEADTMYGERFSRDGRAIAHSEPPQNNLRGLWVPTSAGVGHDLLAVKGNRLALDVSGTVELQEEFAAIRDFLTKDQRLQWPSQREGDFLPHITIARSESLGLANMCIRNTAPPDTVVLDAPSCHHEIQGSSAAGRG